MFDGFTAVSNVSFDVDEGEILGLIGPNGSGKSTIFNCIAGMYVPTAGSIKFAGEEIARPARQPRLPQGHRPHLSDPAPVPQPDAARERGAVGLVRPERQDRRAPPAGARPRRRWASSTCRPTRTRPRTGSAPPRSKKLELARALATQPKLLLADESLNGLDHSEMEQAADMLQRIRREQRHHHRLGRAHHGRADARGRPRGGARSRREDLRRRAEGGPVRPARRRGLSRRGCAA